MRLILLRHGVAAPAESYATDAERPLTPRGARKTARSVKGLLTLLDDVPLRVISSPLLRATETADLLADQLKKAGRKFTRETWDELAAGDLSPLLPQLEQLSGETVILVGHEPGLGCLAIHLLTGDSSSFNLSLGKAGAVCLLQQDNKVTLEWLLLPLQLRLLAKL